MNICSQCGEDFGSTRSFDTHRVGRYPQSNTQNDNNINIVYRRCLTLDELRSRGFKLTVSGRWTTSTYIEPEEATG